MSQLAQEQAALEREMDQQMASLMMEDHASQLTTESESTSTPRRGGPEKQVAPGAYEGSYSGTEEEVICMWIKELVGAELDPTNLHAGLKSGTVLCELVNRIQPRAVKKINSSEMPFAQRENIQAFADSIKTLGVKDINNFMADDLFEAKNMKQVVIGIFALGKQAWFVQDYSGPCLGRPDISSYAEGAPTTPGTAGSKPPLPGSASFQRRYKWDVKPGGSYVPAVPAAAKREQEEKDKEEHRHQRKWEVKFAPQLATATRRTMVVSSDVMNLMNKFSNDSQLRTAVDRRRASVMDGGEEGGAPVHKHKHHKEKAKDTG
eukprot:CAMPEP_0181324540 /NCGR_PEP_ID=MMETSP1101-20121128/20418_1 /TAXON_ID=46948 /ORGANISM="Rhodomonas abbreviata, Strain Caron Lab Isolate" /LENGTH=318 /DNA_ID=CAMNT_0023432731 /DNA_START=444 /DNA_END=1396 /DNA_ORIENTATION=+